ncbi:MAG TPA: hypothetical protein VER03_19420 [Bryobacteraceae bacterium]|nr:hypothetical protein [Bryobacteraceae bacterium]
MTVHNRGRRSAMPKPPNKRETKTPAQKRPLRNPAVEELTEDEADALYAERTRGEQHYPLEEVLEEHGYEIVES